MGSLWAHTGAIGCIVLSSWAKNWGWALTRVTYIHVNIDYQKLGVGGAYTKMGAYMGDYSMRVSVHMYVCM